MVDILPGGTRRPKPPRPSQPETDAWTDDAGTQDIGMRTQQSQESGQSEGRFFRGFIIFLGIAVLFWAVVIALVHFL